MKRKVEEKKEYAIIVDEKVFIGMKYGGVCLFSKDWSLAKTFDDERKFKFFEDNFKGAVMLEV
jgi:hypothetical protein